MSATALQSLSSGFLLSRIFQAALASAHVSDAHDLSCRLLCFAVGTDDVHCNLSGAARLPGGTVIAGWPLVRTRVSDRCSRQIGMPGQLLIGFDQTPSSLHSAQHVSDLLMSFDPVWSEAAGAAGAPAFPV
jgi:hypothetical protein